MWRSTVLHLGWQPQQGDAARAHGHIAVYPARGCYQLYVDQLQPAGRGDLHAQFEALRDRLRAEGLFEAARKRPCPVFPRVVGIVTSPQAAALRDVLNVLRRRYPLARVLLAPALVQGDQAPPQIVAALQALDARDEVDLILLVRGGGSLEELWAFNDEGVARAIAEGLGADAAAVLDAIRVEDAAVHGADRHTGRIGTVHAGHRDGLLARNAVIECHDATSIDAPGDLVLVLAGGNTGIAFDAAFCVAVKLQISHV